MRGKYVRKIFTQRERHNFLNLILLACNENSDLKVIKKKKSYSSRLQAFLTRKCYLLSPEKKNSLYSAFSINTDNNRKRSLLTYADRNNKKIQREYLLIKSFLEISQD